MSPVPQLEELDQESLREKRKLTAVRYLRKILLTKLRSHLKEVKANSWTYYNQRQQKRLRSNLQLFKVMSMVQDKMKTDKFFALNKLKERYLHSSLSGNQQLSGSSSLGLYSKD
jgi:hypothetical protein